MDKKTRERLVKDLIEIKRSEVAQRLQHTMAQHLQNIVPPDHTCVMFDEYDRCLKCGKRMPF